MRFEIIIIPFSVVCLSTIAILPAVVGFPSVVGRAGHQTHIEPLLLTIVLLFDLGALAITIGKSQDEQKRVLRNVALVAAISIIASVMLNIDVRVPIFQIPTPHVLAHFLGVDGEFAYDADVFEIYCELWMFLSALFGIAVLAVKISMTRA